MRKDQCQIVTHYITEMEINMHITMTGNLGSGKSTLSKLVAGIRGYEIYSTGKIQREFAAERGLSVLEMNELMQKDHSFDNLIDDRVRQTSIEHKEDLFFDSRLAWHFAVNTFKVFLSVDIDEAARRVYGDNRGAVEAYASVEEAKEQLLKRAHTEDNRYREIYGIDYFKATNYNLILDSTFSGPETLAEVLLDEKARYERDSQNGQVPVKSRILLAPSRLCSLKSGNTRDNCEIFESTAIVRMSIEKFEVLEGMEQIEQAAREGYEFISVRSVE